MTATQLQVLRKQAYLKRFLSLCCKPGWYAAWCPAQDGVARESLRPLAKSFSASFRKLTRTQGVRSTTKLGTEVFFVDCRGGEYYFVMPILQAGNLAVPELTNRLDVCGVAEPL